MQNTVYTLSPTAAKYKNMRLSLLFVVICTYLNLVLSLLSVYFVFSAYLPTIFCTSGALLYQESGKIIYYVTGVIIAALLAVPYLLCWIFSKKRSGWMIVALIVYIIDTLFFLLDFISLIGSGEPAIFDLLFHVYVIVSLSLGIKYASDMKKEPSVDYAAIAGADATAEGEEPLTRQMSVLRPKTYVGAAAKMIVFINGQPACELKVGEGATLTVPQAAFVIGASLKSGFAANQAIIPAGEAPLTYSVVLKTGLMSSNILFQPM